MQPYINSKGLGVVYIFVVLAFCQRWPVRLNLIDINNGGGRRNQLNMVWLWEAGEILGFASRTLKLRILARKALERAGKGNVFSGYWPPGGCENAHRS